MLLSKANADIQTAIDIYEKLKINAVAYVNGTNKE